MARRRGQNPPKAGTSDPEDCVTQLLFGGGGSVITDLDVPLYVQIPVTKSQLAQCKKYYCRQSIVDKLISE